MIMNFSEKGKTLDIGCGDKRFTKYLDDAVGIDHSLWNETRSPPLMNILDVMALGEYLPFKDETFKSVHAHDVLEHIPGIEKTRNEIYRVLKDDGCLIQVDPNDISLFLSRLLAGRIREAFHRGLYGQGSGHVYSFKKEDLEKLFAGKFILEKSRRWLIFSVYKWRKKGASRENAIH